MRVRAPEIAATVELEKVGGAETVVNQAGATALRPLSTAKDLEHRARQDNWRYVQRRRRHIRRGEGVDVGDRPSQGECSRLGHRWRHCAAQTRLQSWCRS